MERLRLHQEYARLLAEYESLAAQRFPSDARFARMLTIAARLQQISQRLEQPSPPPSVTRQFSMLDRI